MAKNVMLKPVLTQGQWERVLTAEEIPDLDADATAALILHKLGWFTWADANEHERIAGMMDEGVKQFGKKLSELSSVRANPQVYFQAQTQYANLKRHRDWHYDMAVRIGALLPPMELLERLEQEEKHEGEGVEKGD